MISGRGRRGSGCWPDPSCLFTWFTWALSGPGPREATAGSEEKAVRKQEGVLILQLSNPGRVDEVELAFLELSRRFSCCVSLLTLSQTHRTAPALPAAHHLVSVACLSFRGSPSSAYGDVSSKRTRVQSIGGYSRQSFCKNLERC